MAIGSINSPMQCMMKEICAQCLTRHRDPQTGQESVVYTCVNPGSVARCGGVATPGGTTAPKQHTGKLTALRDCPPGRACTALPCPRPSSAVDPVQKSSMMFYRDRNRCTAFCSSPPPSDGTPLIHASARRLENTRVIRPFGKVAWAPSTKLRGRGAPPQSRGQVPARRAAQQAGCD